jgi:hypothetical protein
VLDQLRYLIHGRIDGQHERTCQQARISCICSSQRISHAKIKEHIFCPNNGRITSHWGIQVGILPPMYCEFRCNEQREGDSTISKYQLILHQSWSSLVADSNIYTSLLAHWRALIYTNAMSIPRYMFHHAHCIIVTGAINIKSEHCGVLCCILFSS